MKLGSALLLCSVLLAPMPAFGQSRGPAQEARWARGGPIAVLLEQREALALTPEQVKQLEAIQQRLEERNRPLVEQLVQLREKWHRERPTNWRELTPEERKAARERFQRDVREEARPLMTTVRRNNRETMSAVKAVLTEEQQQRVRELVRARRGPGIPRP